MMTGTCTICGGGYDKLFSGVMLGSYPTDYFRCQECGFVRTSQPKWFGEAYAEKITRSDLGLLARNYFMTRSTTVLLRCLFRRESRFLDYAGGYGIFVRLMRDRGFHFHWYDKYCSNLFAKDFVGSLSDSWDLITAFEVMEHLIDPLPVLAQLFGRTKHLFFTTIPIPDIPPKLDQWWYYATETGQHISFYSMDSLRLLARKFGKHFYSDGKLIHFFSEFAMPPVLFKLLMQRHVAFSLSLIMRRASLIGEDFFCVTGKRIS